MKKMLPTISVIIIIGTLVLIVSKFLMISTRGSVVNPEKFLGSRNNPVGIYATASGGLVYSPFNIHLDPVDKLMLVDIDNDPEYKSIELQTFNDSRGQGARVLLYPHEGPADVYYTNSLFEIRLSENAKYIIDPDMEYYFGVTASGLDASLKMKDSKGKSIEFRVKETQRKRWSEGFLAPIGGSDAVTFRYFPFFYMKDMNFVLRAGTEFTVNIDGISRNPKRLPVPVNLEFVYLSRYTDNPVIAAWNQAYDGQLIPLHADEQSGVNDKRTSYKLFDNNGHYEISSMTGISEKHEAYFDFSPPVPDLMCLKEMSEIEGRFCAGVDGARGIIAGTYRVTRHGNVINMQLQPQKGWQPTPGRLWIKPWRWEGIITIQSDSTVLLKSSWIRGEDL